MKSLKLAFLLCAFTGLSFGASKEVVELQRDVAILQDQVRTLQRTFDEKLAQITLLLQQTQESSNKTNGAVSGLQGSVSQAVGEQLQPLSRVGTKVDGLSDDVRGVRESVNDISSRLSKLDAKVTDLGNQINLSRNPPPAPGEQPLPGGSALGGPPQGGGAPPAGMTAESAYTNAERDRLAGNFDLALKEYQDYLAYFPNTDYAPSAQYYIGEIYSKRGDYDNATKSFDAVLERYPDNPKTPAAQYMKGVTLVRTGNQSAAVKVFRDVMNKYPGTEYSRKAVDQLHGLGVATSTTTRRRR